MSVKLTRCECTSPHRYPWRTPSYAVAFLSLTNVTCLVNSAVICLVEGKIFNNSRNTFIGSLVARFHYSTHFTAVMLNIDEYSQEHKNNPAQRINLTGFTLVQSRIDCVALKLISFSLVLGLAHYIVSAVLHIIKLHFELTLSNVHLLYCKNDLRWGEINFSHGASQAGSQPAHCSE